jgi:hypothetical protein
MLRGHDLIPHQWHETMKQKTIEDLILKPDAKFLVNSVRILSSGQEAQGVGILEVEPTEFVFSVTLSAENASRLPMLAEGTVWRDDFWKMEGTISDSFAFEVSQLPPPSQHSHGIDGVTLRFHADSIKIAPSGFDAMTRSELETLLEGCEKAEPNSEVSNASQSELARLAAKTNHTQPPIAETKSTRTVAFDVILIGFELVAFNGGVESSEENDFLGYRQITQLGAFNGEAGPWRYSMVQRNNDLHIHLRSNPTYNGTDEQDDCLALRAFLSTLAFTHGQHAFPSSLKHRVDLKVIRHELFLRKHFCRMPDAPFSQRLVFDTINRRSDWSFQSALETGYRFFSIPTPFSETINNLLFLLREAYAPGAALRIRVLAICGLFENLVDLIFQKSCTTPTGDDDSVLKTLRTRLLKMLSDEAEGAPDRRPFTLLIRNIKHTPGPTSREKLQAIVDHLHLADTKRWEQIFKQWRDTRNPLAHSIACRDYSRSSLEEEMKAESVIVGAINCLVLRLMDYSGPLCIGGKGSEVGWMRARSETVQREEGQTRE